MARVAHTLSKGSGISYDLSIGVLCNTFKQEKIISILKETNKDSQRIRDLPAEIVVYYVIAMCLFMHVNLKEVLRCLLEGLRNIYGSNAVKITGKSGISQARSRLGSAPMKLLHDEYVKPIATPQTKGVFYRKWKIISMDGSSLDIPDEAANREKFEKRKVKNGGKTPYPQIRFVSLVENGTHVLFGNRMSSTKVGENTLALEVLPFLKEGMLCLADRLFYGYELWKEAAQTGADLLWRMRDKPHLDVEKVLKDGSYLSRVYQRPGPKKKETSLIVRVIEYQLKDSSESYRLITTLLDPDEAPAEELAALYAERWEIESSLDELKTHLRGANLCLRSKKPELIEQEFYGLMMAHFAVRGLMHEAALKIKEDPDRLSYIHTVNVVRRKISNFRAISP